MVDPGNDPLQGGAWGFFCGYLVQSLLSLLSYWKKIKNKTGERTVRVCVCVCLFIVTVVCSKYQGLAR